MILKVGDALPSVLLWKLIPLDSETESYDLISFDVAEVCAAKSIIIVGVTSAFTQTCTQQHVQGYLDLYTHFNALGVDEIWCVSVNDAYVMNAWRKSLGIEKQLSMLADGNAAFNSAIGLTRDLSAKGMGLRSQRYAMLVVNGEVKILNVEPEGKFVVSDAQQIYIQMQGLLDNA